jgi:hypothetical protein
MLSADKRRCTCSVAQVTPQTVEGQNPAVPGTGPNSTQAVLHGAARSTTRAVLSLKPTSSPANIVFAAFLCGAGNHQSALLEKRVVYGTDTISSIDSTYRNVATFL